MSFLRASLFGACALVGATPALGAQAPAPPARDSATAVGAVVITATRGSTTLAQMPLHTTVITRQAIAQSSARTLDQLLRDIPGINLSGAPYFVSDPTGHQTRLRGVTNSKVLVLVDGIPVHDPFYSTTQWFKVPLSNIERVEVLRGGASSTWGNLAVAGVVNIITRKPFDDAAEVDVSYQTYNSLNASVWKNIQAGHGLAFRVSGDVLRTDGYQTTPTEFLNTVPGKGTSSAKNTNLRLSAVYAPSAEWSAFVNAGWHEQNQDIGGYVFGTNLQRGPDASAGFTRTLGEASRFEARAWAQWVDFDKENGAGCYLQNATTCNTTSLTQPLVQYANSRDVNPYRELGGTATVSLGAPGALGAWVSGVQAGVDMRTLNGEDRATTYNRPTTTDPASATVNRTNFGKGNQQFLGAFASMVLTPLPRLAATVSLRYDSWSNTDGVAQMTKYTAGVAGSPAGGAIADVSKSAFNPSVAVRYDVNDHVSVRAAAYQAFRAPGLNNLYRSFSSATSITIANPTLLPETLTGSEGGVDVRLGDVSVGVTAFRYDTKDLVASYRIPNAGAAPPDVIAICGATLANCPATVNFNTNGQDSRSEGVELTGSWHALRTLTLAGAITRTDSRYTSVRTTDPVGVQLGGVPRTVGTFSADWQPTRDWSLSGSVRATSGMYLDVTQTIPESRTGLVNLSTSYRLRPGFEWYATAVNIGDVRYSDNATTNASGKTLGLGRAFTSGIRVRF
jgi:iron complex outermembrane receptor protein